MSDDNIDFSALNNGKTAFFIIISPDSRYTFFTPMLLHQLFMFFLKSPSPEHPARFILDNFADIGYISGLFTCMGISERFKIDILAQSVSQICTLYGRSISELRKYFDTSVCFNSCFKEDAQYFESLSKVNISSIPKDKCLVCMNNKKGEQKLLLSSFLWHHSFLFPDSGHYPLGHIFSFVAFVSAGIRIVSVVPAFCTGILWFFAVYTHISLPFQPR